LEKGHNSVRKGRIKIFNLHVQLRTKGDNPRMFCSQEFVNGRRNRRTDRVTGMLFHNVIRKVVPVVPLFSTQQLKGNTGS